MNSRFLDACRRRPTDVRPVWFMRQAGRYMKQYREIRAKNSILEICKRPDLAATVTLQPVESLDVDAAVIFADLLRPVEPLGLKLMFVAGEGPVIDNPVRTSSDIDSLSTGNSDELGYVGEAIHLVVRQLAGRVPVIGFVGAPFTDPPTRTIAPAVTTEPGTPGISHRRVRKAQGWWRLGGLRGRVGSS